MSDDAPSRAVSTWERSALKAASYRLVIICLDFSVVYLLTRRLRVALGFMVISNVYTTIAYFLHERLWARVAWGLNPAKDRM